MSTTKHSRTGVCFFWIGVATSVACVAVVFARDNEFLWRFERSSFPLSGVFGGVAALAFLVTELCDSLFNPRKPNTENSAPVLRMDESVKVSKQEVIAFMETEFDRLDDAKRGELDVQKLHPLKVAPGGRAPDGYRDAPADRSATQS
jgi:hypothetical protein